MNNIELPLSLEIIIFYEEIIILSEAILIKNKNNQIKEKGGQLWQPKIMLVN